MVLEYPIESCTSKMPLDSSRLVIVALLATVTLNSPQLVC